MFDLQAPLLWVIALYIGGKCPLGSAVNCEVPKHALREVIPDEWELLRNHDVAAEGDRVINCSRSVVAVDRVT